MIFETFVVVGLVALNNVAADTMKMHMNKLQGSNATGTIGQTQQQSLTKAFKDNCKTPLAASLDWNEFNNEINTVVLSNSFCSCRNAMAHPAGLAAGVAASVVPQPAYAALTTEVKMTSAVIDGVGERQHPLLIFENY